MWIAMLVYAYSRGGASRRGVALVQLAPGALLARYLLRWPTGVLLWFCWPGAPGTGGRAGRDRGSDHRGCGVAAYAGAVVTCTAISVTRPAQSTLVPSLAATPDQLTAANVVVGWVEAAGIAAAGSLTGC